MMLFISVILRVACWCAHVVLVSRRIHNTSRCYGSLVLGYIGGAVGNCSLGSAGMMFKAISGGAGTFADLGFLYDLTRRAMMAPPNMIIIARIRVSEIRSST